MSQSVVGSWLMFWRAIWSKIDPEARLQDQLDRRHAELDREREERMKRYHAVWSVYLEAAKTKHHEAAKQMRQETRDLRVRYMFPRKVG